MKFDLLSRILTGEANAEEKEQFYLKLGDNKASEQMFYEIKSLWLRSSLHKNNIDIDSEFDILCNRIIQPAKQSSYPIWKRAVQYAAIILFVLIIGGLSGYLLSNINQKYADSGVQKNSSLKGSVSIVEFGDGTKVWLNSGSQLNYSEDHKGKKRIAELTGEGYFEVAHDAEFPFFVKAGNIMIRDLGTTFNIKAYPGDKTIETSLVEGKADIISGKGNSAVTLKPGDCAIYYNENKRIEIKPIVENVLSAWRDGKFVIRDQRLEDIFKEISRWYDVEIRFENQKLKDYRYTGIIKKSTTSQHVLKMLKLTTKFNYRIIEKPAEPDVIIVY